MKKQKEESELVHIEHCKGCLDPMCKPIPLAKVTDNKSKVTCKNCLSLIKKNIKK